MIEIHEHIRESSECSIPDIVMTQCVCGIPVCASGTCKRVDKVRKACCFTKKSCFGHSHEAATNACPVVSAVTCRPFSFQVLFSHMLCDASRNGCFIDVSDNAVDVSQVSFEITIGRTIVSVSVHQIIFFSFISRTVWRMARFVSYLGENFKTSRAFATDTARLRTRRSMLERIFVTSGRWPRTWRETVCSVA